MCYCDYSNPATGLSCGKPGCTPTALKGRPVLSRANQNDCEHGRQIGKCGDCEYQDLLGELSDVRDELATVTAQRDELLQTVKAVQTMCHGAIRVRIDGIIAKCEVQNG